MSEQLPTPNSQLPTPNSQLPTPNSQLPTPNSAAVTPARHSAETIIAAAAAAGKKDVPIVFCADKNYGLYLPVVVQSIIENSSSGYHYHIIVFDCGIEREVVDALARQIRQYGNFSLHVKNIESWLEQHKEIFRTHDYWSAATYGRFLIPEICLGYEKVIYADIDMIFNRDVAELTEIDLGENYIAGVSDTAEECRRLIDVKHEEYLRKFLGLGKDDVCINAGLTVFNIALWRSRNLVQKAIELLEKKKFKLLDQDALCSLCRGKIYVLRGIWNNLIYPKRYIDNLKVSIKHKNIACIERITDSYLQSFYSNDAVFHYNTANKPWNKLKEMKSDLWWQYAVRTQFFGRYFSDIMPSRSVRQKDTYSFFGLPIVSVKCSQKYKRYLLGGIVRVAQVTKDKKMLYVYIFGIKCFSKSRSDE